MVQGAPGSLMQGFASTFLSGFSGHHPRHLFSGGIHRHETFYKHLFLTQMDNDPKRHSVQATEARGQ